MTLLNNKHLRWLIFWGFFSAFVFSFISGGDDKQEPAKEPVTVMEDLRLPFEYYDDGRVKVQVLAGNAAVFADETIKATEVSMEFYDEKGNLESIIALDGCEFDRGKGIVRSYSNVRFAKSKITITSKGAVLNTKKEKLYLLDDVKVTIERDQTSEKTSLFGKGS